MKPGRHWHSLISFHSFILSIHTHSHTHIYIHWYKYPFDTLLTPSPAPPLLLPLLYIMNQQVWLKRGGLALAWFGGFITASRAEFALVYVIVSGLALVFMCLDYSQRKPGTYSAYSVFNEDGYKLPGTMDAAQIDQQLRNRGMPAAGAAGGRAGLPADIRSHSTHGNTGTVAAALNGKDLLAAGAGKRSSKNANKPCQCGSGKKFKKCCMTRINAAVADASAERYKRPY
jgi:Uncharacterized conserved domain (SAYSvFN)/SEC-C motif